MWNVVTREVVVLIWKVFVLVAQQLRCVPFKARRLALQTRDTTRCETRSSMIGVTIILTQVPP